MLTIPKSWTRKPRVPGVERPSRRRFLRGMCAGVPIAIGLPALELVLNTHGTAYADGTPLLRRFGTWFFAAGVMQGWHPDTTGELVLPPAFSPLEPYRASLSMISGLHCPSFGDPSTNRHIMGAAAQLTGHPPANGSEMTAASLDQIVADHLADAPRRAMIVGVTGYGSGESGTGWHAISHNGPNSPNQAQLDPRAVYQDMFAGAARPAPTGFDDAPHRLAYLDACKEDIATLRGQLGAHDRMRLEGYLDGIREVESKIESIGTSASCSTAEGATDGITDDMIDVDDHVTAVNQVMARLVAIALGCGLTQVFSYQFMEQNSFRNFGGLSNNHHELGHQQSGDLEASVQFIMARFAELLAELAAIPEGAGTVLDNTAILAMTETSWEHNMDNMLSLVAGRAGGALAGGRHVNESGPTSRAALTVMQALGLPIDSFGVHDAATSEIIDALL